MFSYPLKLAAVSFFTLLLTACGTQDRKTEELRKTFLQYHNTLHQTIMTEANAWMVGGLDDSHYAKIMPLFNQSLEFWTALEIDKEKQKELSDLRDAIVSNLMDYRFNFKTYSELEEQTPLVRRLMGISDYAGLLASEVAIYVAHHETFGKKIAPEETFVTLREFTYQGTNSW